jgi:hypothetical protein
MPVIHGFIGGTYAPQVRAAGRPPGQVHRQGPSRVTVMACQEGSTPSDRSKWRLGRLSGWQDAGMGTIMLLDAASMYFRAFYGVPETMTAPDGTP